VHRISLKTAYRFWSRCATSFFLCWRRPRCRKLQVCRVWKVWMNLVLTKIAIPSEENLSKRATISWDEAYTKATAALAKLSQNDKIGIVTGVGWQGGNCVGNTKAASSIGYPSLCLQGKHKKRRDWRYRPD